MCTYRWETGNLQFHYCVSMAALDEHHQAQRLRFKEHEWGIGWHMEPLSDVSPLWSIPPHTYEAESGNSMKIKSLIQTNAFPLQVIPAFVFHLSLLARKVRKFLWKVPKKWFNWERLENKSFAARVCWWDCIKRERAVRSLLFGFFSDLRSFLQIFAMMGEIEK